MLDRAAPTAVVADRTLETGTSEDDYGGKQEDSGAQVTFATSSGAGTDRGKEGLDNDDSGS